MPLFILVYCYCQLIKQIYISLHGTHHRYFTSKITLILVSIIMLFLLLFSPSMIITFMSEVIGYTCSFIQIAIAITNLMQCINFANNFVLYSVICKQFCQMFINTLCCKLSLKLRPKTPQP